MVRTGPDPSDDRRAGTPASRKEEGEEGGRPAGWEDEAAIISTLPAVVAKLLVCPDQPGASIVGGGISASAVIGDALLTA